MVSTKLRGLSNQAGCDNKILEGVNTSGTKEGVADECQISKNKDGSEGSKTKFEKVVDERVNKGKSVPETSGAKKGKMKVIEKLKTKKRKGAEKYSNKSLRKDKSAKGNEANPQVKRPKLGKVKGQKKLTYVYSVKVPVNDLKKGRPFIRYVRTSHLEEIEVEEINQNRLGMGDIEQRSVVDGETSNT
ncbi:hypothetical protein L2E82_38333 [Cichorium intybus]|uniref:Uncharacterized protein n=1 Tax=Cichorium intybus TaxID=13427 RepID=A0ACB9AH49_CICIN|nr:hypothetical protein L2E82_38333 [Cichorium intybus]